MLDFVLPVLILSCRYVVDSTDPPVGHLKPIGSHRPPMTSIEERGGFPTPQEMFEKYVKASKPVIFRGILEKGMLPAYKLWTDDYLREKYGSESVDVESGKKENRKWNMLSTSMADFLNRYKTEDIYMVNDVSPKMAEDINMPSMFLCGGFQNVVQNVIMWFSSGGTKSVLHNDGLDNVNCLIDGEKYLVMIDKKHKAEVEDSGWINDGQYSKVDVEKVDLLQFPKLRDLPWYEIKLHKGDCVFIPFKWYHHVDSKNGRNLAINIWLHHLTKFNESNCNNTGFDESKFVTVSQFRKERKVTDFRDFLLGELEDLKHIDWPTFENFVKPFSLLKAKEIEELFDALDADDDDKIIEHEVMIANMEDLFRQIPSLQHLLEESPDEESLGEMEDNERYMDSDKPQATDEIDEKELEEQHRVFANAARRTMTEREDL